MIYILFKNYIQCQILNIAESVAMSPKYLFLFVERKLIKVIHSHNAIDEYSERVLNILKRGRSLHNDIREIRLSQRRLQVGVARGNECFRVEVTKAVCGGGVVVGEVEVDE